MVAQLASASRARMQTAISPQSACRGVGEEARGASAPATTTTTTTTPPPPI